MVPWPQAGRLGLYTTCTKPVSRDKEEKACIDFLVVSVISKSLFVLPGAVAGNQPEAANLRTDLRKDPSLNGNSHIPATETHKQSYDFCSINPLASASRFH